MPDMTGQMLEKVLEDLSQPRWRGWLRLSISIALSKFDGDIVETEKWLGLNKGESKIMLRKE